MEGLSGDYGLFSVKSLLRRDMRDMAFSRATHACMGACALPDLLPVCFCLSAAFSREPSHFLKNEIDIVVIQV
jgi:hypothetical protein